MSLPLIGPDALGHITLVPCYLCEGAGVLDEPDPGGDEDYRVDAACEGLGYQLNVTRGHESLLLLMARLRWLYSDEPERLGIHEDRFEDVESTLITAMSRRGIVGPAHD